MKPEPAQSDPRETEAVAEVNRLLANQFLLRSKMRNYRWNFRGSRHRDLDRILKNHGRELDRMIEGAVEIIDGLGGSVAGSLTEILANADLIGDEPARGVSPVDAVKGLAEGHEKLSSTLVQRCKSVSEELPKARQIRELFQEWSQQHHQLALTLKAIGSNRLHLH